MATIWITGGKGFIGRHLARLIFLEGNRVCGIGHGLWPAEEARKWGYTDWCNGEIEATNLSQLAHVSGLPDVVYHLAGGSSVGASLLHPREDFCRSVESTSRLLEWCRLNTRELRIVSVSSAAVYGVTPVGPISERSDLRPYSPYGVHKSMMEGLCQAYARSFGLSLAIVRLFSVYGAGLEKQLIWDLCIKLKRQGNSPVLLGGTGTELRDWVHVTDAAALLWLVRGQCDASCPVINGGTGIATSIHEVAGTVCEAWGEDVGVTFSGIARVGDPPCLVADSTKAAHLGFKPRVRLDDGIHQTVGWFKARG
ncbi:MAG: NAD(P)-dependent oxidoreductase [Nitrospira sp.]|nr:NAD(P)-dependent oxidoreductase [Nitrospira sp.]MDR4469927.1 NAD(P)-dependent oxidoreductase [Nitrospira sp.]